MQLSKVSYYGDFFIYPVAVPALAAAALWLALPHDWDVWLIAFVGGFALWTLTEYVLHRFVLHHVPYIKDMHEAHHGDQRALIGTPTWLSAVMMLCIVFLPLIFVSDFVVAGAMTSGLMLGYLWYVSVHHIVHHWRVAPGSYGFWLKRRHMLHHHFDEMGNFGVTSGFWDKVFGTDLKARAAAERRR